MHLRNEHANVQYRIDGVLLPDGVSGFGQVLESGLIGNIGVIDGALPAQYGLHTSGIVDITTKNGAFDGGGAVSIYGGSRQTITPSVEYGGTIGNTQYFLTGRYFGQQRGHRYSTSSENAIYDHSDQGKFFGYVSDVFGEGARLTLITGSAVGGYQIPNNPNQPPAYTVPGVGVFNSSQINEESGRAKLFRRGRVAANRGRPSTIRCPPSRAYSSLRFDPDPIGDLVFNGVAATVVRTSFLNGVQGDAAVPPQRRAHNADRLQRKRRTNARQRRLGRLSRRRVRQRQRAAVRDADGFRVRGRVGCSASTRRTSGRSPTNSR